MLFLLHPEASAQTVLCQFRQDMFFSAQYINVKHEEKRGVFSAGDEETEIKTDCQENR